MKILQIVICIDTQNYREDGRNGRDGSGILYEGKVTEVGVQRNSEHVTIHIQRA